jgi:hypothetical protein
MSFSSYKEGTILVPYLHNENDPILKGFNVTPYSRVLPEELIVAQLLTKFPACYGTLMFITMSTRVCTEHSQHSFKSGSIKV